MKRFTISLLLGYVAIMVSLSTSANAEQPPAPASGIRATKALSGEELYPNVKRLELDEVRSKHVAKTAIVIDARSAYEYDTLHINGALNVALSDPFFVQKLRKIRETDKRPIIFYCNGLTCMKSFRAAKVAMDANIENVSVYPYGVLSWAKAHPEEALLFGKQLTAEQLIADDYYKAKKLSPDAFFEAKEKSQGQSIVLDVRSSDEVGGIKIWPGAQYNIPLNNDVVRKYIDKARTERKKLLIYDESGHQIRWLQYFLYSEGFEDYFFLDGGYENYMRMIDKDGKYVMSEYIRERMKAQLTGGQVD